MRSCAPLLAGAVVAFAFWSPGEDAARAQAETTGEALSFEAGDSPIAILEGSWARNEKVSEDPVQKTISLWRNPDRTSATLVGLASSLADRVGRLRITVEEGQVRLRNAEFEIFELPVDGSAVADQYGNRHRASVLPGTLEIETSRPGWLLIETLYVQAGQLHRVIEIQSERFPNLRFLTVYDHSGDELRSASSTDDDMSRLARPAAIRIVPPHRGHHELLTGRVEVGTLIVDSTIGRVDFFLDSRRRKRVGKPPFRTRINLADPPREQTLEVRAYSVRGAYVGDDRVVLNRVDPPFAVRIGAITPHETDVPAVQVETRIAVPRGASLERVEFYRGEQLAQAVDNLAQHPSPGGFRTVTGSVSTRDLSPQDYVRVTARLADGREMEDAELLQGAEFKGEIDVQLIHLQVLVVDADGNPVGGLRAADFRIVEDGEQRAVEELRRAGDVPLVLGMAIDSSASMKPVWNQLKSVAGAFLESSLTETDRAFLVDFDETIRLLQPPTGDTPTLRKTLERLVANGGTALNDGILFSLVQYGNEPGRRALVVVTDGVDIDSRSEPEQAGSFAERVGIPLYFIDLGRDQVALLDTNTSERDSTPAPTMRSARSDAHLRRMRQLARRSGGRLFRIDLELPPPDFVAKVHGVFDRIKEDLLHQYVLTYYSDRPLGSAIEPEVRTSRTDLEVRSALPLYQSDDG
ncbi:MAG: VWA domain-containing protein [Acidobacteria bacterium]|nr:VWA domain-containing protein [Acidobacteriota bacterium]